MVIKEGDEVYCFLIKKIGVVQKVLKRSLRVLIYGENYPRTFEHRFWRRI